MTRLMEFPASEAAAPDAPSRPSVKPSKILLVGSDRGLADLVMSRLGHDGHAFESAESAFEAEEKALEQDYAVIVLILSSDDGAGMEICRNLRRLGVSTPILALAPYRDPEARVRVFESGADHCLSMPLDEEELSARVRALMRRGSTRETTRLRFEDIEMDLVRRTVHRAGERIPLSQREFELLEYMVRNPNRVLSRSAIAERVWGRRERTQSNVISVYVYMLRKKVDKPFDKRLIYTVSGTGYVLRGGDGKS